MKVEILKENLKEGLSVVERVAVKNLSLPILDNVFITTEDNFLSLTSTDLETAIKLWILTKIVKRGRVVVPAKFLSSFVSLLPNDKIIMEEDNQKLRIECNNFNNQIQGFNPEDFPLIPEFKNLEYVEIDNKKFCQGLTQVVDVASPSQSRPEISGIYFVFSGNTIKMVATDSFRLAEKNISLESPIKRGVSFILPQKPAKDIIGILEGREGNIRIYFSPSQIMFEILLKELNHPQVQIISRLIDGEYPNYEEIIPKKFKTKVTIKRDEFLNQIKAASLFAGKINEVKLTLNEVKNEIEIFAKDPELGENKSLVSGKIEGEPMEISFNYKFLIDGLQSVKSSEVLLELSQQDGPCLLKPVGDASYIYVVMPIKAN